VPENDLRVRRFDWSSGVFSRMSHIRSNTLLHTSIVLASLALIPSCTAEVADTDDDDDTTVRAGCPLPLDIGLEVPFKITGTVPDAPSEIYGTCAGYGPEATFLWTAPDDGSYTFDTAGSNYDTVLYLRNTDCFGPDLACNDDKIGLLSEVTVELAAGEVVYIVIDAYHQGGDYVLNIAHHY
jgi:hypothetical protein